MSWKGFLMVISHEHKFIYLPVPKTASRSIRTALAIYGAVTVAYHCLKNVVNHQCITPTEYAEYVTVASVRNPYRRCLSNFLYHGQEPKQPLYEHCRKIDFTEFMDQYGEIGINKMSHMVEGCRIDHLVRVEHSIEDQLRQHLPFITKLQLPRRNASQYNRPWKAYYTPVAVKRVQQLMQLDFEQFKYSTDFDLA